MAVKKHEDKKTKKQAPEGIRKNIVRTLSEITKIEEAEISDGILVREEIGMDSLEAMEIVVRLEKRYNIKINEAELEKIKTVGEFIDLFMKEITF